MAEILWIGELINNRNVFFTVPEARKFKLKFPDSQSALFSLCPPWGKGQRTLQGLYKSTNCIHEGFTIIT